MRHAQPMPRNSCASCRKASTPSWAKAARASPAASASASRSRAHFSAARRFPDPPLGTLEFRNVEFRYPTRPDAPALHDFSLAIRPRETVAIVGPSGAGKSTLFQLAERFYDPQGGQILLDGIPLIDADPADIRARIAMVPQETVIFAASARDNLRYGNWDATDEQLWDAARGCRRGRRRSAKCRRAGCCRPAGRRNARRAGTGSTCRRPKGRRSRRSRAVGSRG